MVSDRRSTTNLWIGPRHGLYHARKYYERGEKCPVVIAIGVEPTLLLAATSDIPMGVNECDVAGGLKGEPVKLVKCETIDLEVPANSEIVLEGYLDLDPDRFKPEGPFGEYPGYYSELGSVLRPVFTVNCITHRNDPIFLASPVGVASHFGVGDPESAVAVTLSAQIWDRIENVGVQGITGVWTPPEAIFHNVYISINKLFYGHAQWVASALWGAIPFAGKLVIVVDSDVDVYDMRRVNSALAYRFQAYRGLMVSKGHMSSLDPSVDPDQRKKAGDIGRWDKILLDATWPSDWEPRKEWGGLRHPPSCLADSEDIEKVRNRWNEYGLK
jgi:4-hydroxy-3-polyprenylbenzoate decarboxylase